MCHVRVKDVGNGGAPELNSVIAERIDEFFEKLVAVKRVLKAIFEYAENALKTGIVC